MIRPYAFWDSSVLVSLCVAQTSTSKAIQWFHSYRIIAWWGTPIEMTSAFMRLRRDSHLDEHLYSEAQKQARNYSRLWSIVTPSSSVAARAHQLLERYPLRAADSLQLAAALIWSGDDPEGKSFLTFDHKLAQAAANTGFLTE